MSPQEIILSSCSGEASSSSTPGRAASAPAIHTHDLLSAAPLHAFKTSTASLASTSFVPTQHGVGGAVFAVQEGKALAHVWAWQKDQMHMKLHLPEKLSCFAISPNGYWAVGGSPSGQIYLWEISSGLLLSSFTGHYRTVTSLSFTNDSHMLLSASLDSSVHVYLVSRLVAEDDSGPVGKPYGTLKDHTLGIRAVAIGKTAGAHGGRCWTASDDGTVKVSASLIGVKGSGLTGKIWSLHPPFDLLTTFSLLQTVIPTALAIDPTERFFYIGTSTGDIYHVPLFRHRPTLGASNGDGAGGLEAIGGGGQGSASIKTSPSVISVKSPITTLTLSLSSTHLLAGTQSGDIHIHALPSHQHLRTLSSHSGPITHLSVLLRPPDIVGAPSQTKTDEWPLMEIKPFERMRAGGPARDIREVAMVLRSKGTDGALDGLRLKPKSTGGIRSAGPTADTTSTQIATLENENKRLKASLDRAIKVNEKMWAGVVTMKLDGNEAA